MVVLYGIKFNEYEMLRTCCRNEKKDIVVKSILHLRFSFKILKRVIWKDLFKINICFYILIEKSFLNEIFLTIRCK